MEGVGVLDFGSQYTQLIARRIRECKVYSQILPYNISPQEIVRRGIKALIFSGGPESVREGNVPLCNRKVFDLGIPILGICYGAQLMAKMLGGRVEKGEKREYGKTVIYLNKREGLFKGLAEKEIVWMSHSDCITALPHGFKRIAFTEHSPIAAMEDEKRRFYGLQFHPEVTHTPKGKRILKNFLRIAGCAPTWNMHSFIERTIKGLRAKIGEEKVLCALSGGVDSSVLSVLLYRAIGRNLIAVFIDNGLLRKGEKKLVQERFKAYGIDIRVINAQNLFLEALKGVEDPERKRRIIGRLFIKVFTEEAKRLIELGERRIRFLAQGTLYPDVIESVSPFGGPSSTIKTHHNVGGLPKRLGFSLIEPLRELFKDEVRRLGRELGLPEEIIYRQPFPGPGLAVRILGEVSKRKLEILRLADWILLEEIKKAGLYHHLWQSFCILLPVRSVGIMGDKRTYERVVAIRAVESEDAMTAHWARLPYSLLERVSNRIINEVKGVNRVVYDISSKPPSTIEWE